MNISNMIALMRRRRLASGSLVRVRGALIVEQTVTMNSSNMIALVRYEARCKVKQTLANLARSMNSSPIARCQSRANHSIGKYDCVAGMMALSRDVRVRGALIGEQTARGWLVLA